MIFRPLLHSQVSRTVFKPVAVVISSRFSTINEPVSVQLLNYLQKLEQESQTLSNNSGRLSKGESHTLALFRQVHPSYETLRDQLSEAADLKTFLHDKSESDSELRNVAKTDLEALEKKVDSTVQHLVSILIPEEKYDLNDATLEVRAGAGGLEAGLFAEEVFDLYRRYMESKGFNLEITVFDTLGVGAKSKFSSSTGIQTAVALISGDLGGAFKALKYECGVHRVQRVPITGTKNDRLQTSTCSVAVVPLPNTASIELLEKDLKIEFTRASGPGGQNVNKSESAVRLVHKPTGMTTECQESKTAEANKKRAIEKLKAMIYAKNFEDEMSRVSKTRKSQIGNMDRNEKIRTYNWSRNMITDHRIGMSKQVPGLKDFFLGQHDAFGILDEFAKELERISTLEKLQDLLNS